MKSTLKQNFATFSFGALALGIVACTDSDMSSDTNGMDDDVVLTDLYPSPLPSEEMLVTDTIKNVNKGFVYAHDMNFGSLITGRIVILDMLAKNRNFKGQINSAQFAAFTHSASRSELYVAETFYSRGVRGDRTDIMAIYDANSLMLEDEIILPNNNRGLNVVQKGNFRISQDESLAFIFTFTPASGVIVVDLNRRRVVNEISIPGCSMVYPFRDRGFAMLCGDGTLVSYDLNGDGKVISEHTTDAFHDIDNHPMFVASARVGDVMYWPTFSGQLISMDFGSTSPELLDKWDFAKGSGYLPSGWQLITADKNGQLYVLMLEGAGNGDHKHGSDEVWELDPVTKRVVRKIKLNSGAFSIEALKTDNPILAVISYNKTVDAYDLKSKKQIQSIGEFQTSDLFLLHASEINQ